MMNPPFRRGLDVQHILHARRFLKPGGLLISLCYGGIVQARGLRPIATTWEVLPSGSFKSEGTTAETVLLTLSA
jgi:16S rRNA G1207 methylase RsmC